MAEPSTISITSPSGKAYMGSKISFKMTNSTSGITHILKYNFNNHQYIFAEGVGSAYDWTPDLSSFASWCTDAKYKTCTIICSSYQGSKYLGFKELAFPLYVPEGVTPDISSVTVTDTSGLYDTYKTYVSGRSKLKVDIIASGKYNATIMDYKSVMGNMSAKGSSAILGSPQSTAVDSIVITVTDSRGFTTSHTQPITVSGSTPSSLTEGTQAYRTPDDESSTVRVDVAGTLFNVNGVSNISGNIVIKYKRESASSWTTHSTTSVSTSTFSFYKSITGISSDYTYNFEIVLTDNQGVTVTRSINVISASPTLDFRSDGRSIGLWTVAPAEQGLHVNGILRAKNKVIFDAVGALEPNFSIETRDKSGQTWPMLELNPPSVSGPSGMGSTLDIRSNNVSIAGDLYTTNADIYGVKRLYATYITSTDKLYLEWGEECGIGGMVADKIYDAGSGYWKVGGSITKEGFAKYNVFLVYIYNNSESDGADKSPVIAIRSNPGSPGSGRVSGVGGVASSNKNAIWEHAVYFTIDSNYSSSAKEKWIMTSQVSVSLGSVNNSGLINQGVKRIYGVI